MYGGRLEVMAMDQCTKLMFLCVVVLEGSGMDTADMAILILELATYQCMVDTA